MEDEYRILWEILLPSHSNHKKIKLMSYQKWYEHVGKNIDSSAVLSNPVLVFWFNFLFNFCIHNRDHAILVRISCGRKQLAEIVDFSALHFKQKEMKYYQISSGFEVKNYDSSFKRIIKNP